MFPYFELFGKTVGLYAICGIAGILTGGATACALGKKRGISQENVILATLFAVLGTLIGGHILYALTNIKALIKCISQFSENGFSKSFNLIATVFSGSVFYGGLFGALILTRIFIRKVSKSETKKNDFYDIFAITIPLFHVFGRIGCFLGGCCYGKESSFGFIAENNPLVPELGGIRRFPVALAEALGNLLIWALLMFLWKKKKTNGMLTDIYLCIYSVLRFNLEFLRGDSIRGIFLGLSTSQWISLAVFPVALILLILKLNAKKQLGQTAEKANL